MNRPSDKAIAQAVEEQFANSGSFIHYHLLMRRARELDATAAPVVVGEDMVERAYQAAMKFRATRTDYMQERSYRGEIKAALTAAMAAD